MPLVSQRMLPGDALNLQQVSALATGPLMDSIFDPDSPDYRPDLDIELPDKPSADQRTLAEVSRNDWVTTKLANYAARQAFEDDPNFVHPWAELDERHDEYADDYAATGSADEWNYLKYTINQSLADDDYMATAGFKDTMGYMGYQMMDPVLMPLYIASLPLGVAKGGAAAMGQAAVRTGAYVTAEVAAIEGVLQLTDPTRTAGESAATIAGAAVIGSLFGAAGQGVVNAFGKTNTVKLRGQVEDMFERDMRVRRAIDEQGSIGAASTKTTLSDERPTFNPTKAITLRSPTLRLLYDDVSAAASRGVDELVPHNVLKNKHMKGVSADEQPLASGINQAREKNTGAMVIGISKAKSALRKRGIKMSSDDIAIEVGRAARRGDEHAIPEIRELATRFRKIVDEWGDRAVKSGLITEEALEGVASYFPRVYDVHKISRNFSRWRDVIGAHFARKYPDLDAGELEEIASSIHNTLSHANINEAHIGGFKIPQKVLKSGHLKARTLDISDMDIEEFLIDDVRYVTNHYMRSIAPGVMAREAYGSEGIGLTKAGAPYIKSIMEEMDGEYTLAKQHLADAGKSTSKLDKKWKRAKEDMEYLMSTVLGHGNPSQGYGNAGARLASSEARAFTAAASLGYMVVSALPDMANLILSHGLANLIKSVPAIVRPRNLSNSAKQDWDSLALGLDTILSTRMLRMADIEERSFNAYTRGLGGQTVANAAFKAFGANLWNSWMKRAAATATQNRVLKDVSRYASLSKQRKARLAQLGINETWATRFSDNFNRQTEKTRQGSNWADLKNWDEEAASRFERMLFREVETTIVTPQAGDIPRVLDNSVGLLFAQFKRFVMSHQLQIMTQASQRLSQGDLAVANYIVAAFGLAVMNDYIRIQSQNGFDQDEVDKIMDDRTFSDWIFIGVDRGALASFGTDLLMGIDGLSDGRLGSALGFSDKARYSSVGLGLEQRVPALGLASRATKVGKAGFDAASGGDPFNQSDLNNLRRMLPLQNTFYLAWLFDQLQQGITDELNLPEGGRKRKIKL